MSALQSFRAAWCLAPLVADLSIKKTPPRHQRVPSHEAIAKVAKQHKVPLPPPVMPPPPLPPSLLPAAGPQPQQQQVRSLDAAGLEPQGPGLGAANGHVPQRQQRWPQQPIQQQPGLAERQASQAVLGSAAAATMSHVGAAAATTSTAAATAPCSEGALLSHVRVANEQSGSATATPTSRPLSAAAGDASSSASGSRSSPGNALFAPSSSALLGLDAATQERQRTAQAVYGEK